MIFKPELARLVVSGVKKQTRRPVKPGQPCRYKPGKHVALQPGRGQKAIDRILIKSVARQTLGDIDHQAALAEGFKSVEEFRDYWRALYRIPDHRPTPWDMEVWVITFELYRPPPVEIHRRAPTRRLTKGYSMTMIHLRSDDGTETWEAKPMPEPEQVDPADVANGPTAIMARERWRYIKAEQDRWRRSQPLGVQLTAALASAKAAGIDTSRYEKEFTAKIRSLEARARRNAA